MIIIGWIVKKVAGLLVSRSLAAGGGLTEQRATFLARVILAVTAAVLLVAGWLVFDLLNDKAAVREHEAARVADTLEAERRANSNDTARRAAASEQSRATEAELETIHAQHPEAAAAPAAPGSRAVAARLPAR